MLLTILTLHTMVMASYRFLSPIGLLLDASKAPLFPRAGFTSKITSPCFSRYLKLVVVEGVVALITPIDWAANDAMSEGDCVDVGENTGPCMYGIFATLSSTVKVTLRLAPTSDEPGDGYIYIKKAKCKLEQIDYLTLLSYKKIYRLKWSFDSSYISLMYGCLLSLQVIY